MERTVNVRITQKQIERVFARLPDVISGKLTRAAEQRRLLLIRIGLTVLQKIRSAFKVKMRGGTDESGLRWAPLSGLTLWLRKHRKKNKSQSTDILRDTGALLESLSPGATANSAPYIIPKVTKQIFRLRRGEVILGTSRKWAKKHHEGLPPKIPRRRLWPDPKNWPTSWWDAILKQAQMGVMDIAIKLVKGTP